MVRCEGTSKQGAKSASTESGRVTSFKGRNIQGTKDQGRNYQGHIGQGWIVMGILYWNCDVSRKLLKSRQNTFQAEKVCKFIYIKNVSRLIWNMHNQVFL